ncbi:hypothetical protein [Rhizobium sp.]|uniref:hypothetical protein n=1 Tax=Rhizobium sp. TaxID=391 RepID=UPI003F8070EC
MTTNEKRAQPVRVKALEWVKDWGGSEDDIPEWRAKTPFGTLCASVAGCRDGSGNRFERHADVPDALKTELIAKSEAHYHAQLRSALSSPVEGGTEKEERRADGNRPLPYDRDTLGRFVRDAWVRWAETQPDPKPSWLLPYDELSEADKEADRQIGEAVARWTLIGDAASSSFASPSPSAEAIQKIIGDQKAALLDYSARNIRLNDQHEELQAEIEALRVENERLRKVAERFTDFELEIIAALEGNRLQATIRHALAKANAALQQQGEGK